jgi:zinc transport system substrate-binding protein
MAALTGARAYFAIGVPFEKVWLEKIAAANPKMQMVHTDRGIPKRSMAAHHHHDEPAHHHDAEPDHHHKAEAGHHHHGEADHGEPHEAADPHEAHTENHHEGHGKQGETGQDPHIWLSPPLVKKQAHHILTAVKTLDPEHSAEYEPNYHRLVTAIDALDDDLRATFARHQGLEFMVFHPSWGYFADAYGLTQVPIELEGKDPKPAQLQTLIRHARERGIKVIFAQPQFSAKSARLIAREIGGQGAFADPLAADRMENLRSVAARFKAALK